MNNVQERVRGYKTLFVAAIFILVAVAKWAGMDIPVGGEEEVLATGGVLMALLRFITTTPVRG